MRRALLAIVLLLSPRLLAQPSVIGNRAASLITSTTFAALGTPSASSVRYCSTCNEGTFPCTGGGTGSFAYRIGGAWACPTMSAAPTASGSAGGDLSGTYPNPTVAKVNGVAYSASPSTNTVPVITSSNTVTYETVPVAAGGTGAATLTANNVLLGNGTSALQAVAPSTSGNVLTSNGTTWTSAAASSGITNSAGANVIPKSNGTNLVASGITDDATTVSTSEKVAITSSAAANVPFSITGAASQSGNLLNLTANGGAAGGLGYFDSSGRAYFANGYYGTSNGFQVLNGSGTAKGQLTFTNWYQQSGKGNCHYWSSNGVGSGTSYGLCESTPKVNFFGYDNSGTDTVVGWLQTAGACYVTADQTNATTTMASTTCSMTVLASRKYSGVCELYLSDSVAADGAKIDFNGGTATSTNFIAQVTAFDTALNLSTQTTAISTAASASTFTGAGAFEVHFSFESNAAGTFIPRFAQVAHTAGVLTLARGSNCRMTDMQ